jgi:hypothetical protein
VLVLVTLKQTVPGPYGYVILFNSITHVVNAVIYDPTFDSLTLNGRWYRHVFLMSVEVARPEG